MGSLITEIQTTTPTPTPTGRLVNFTRALEEEEVQLFNTENTRIARPGDFIIDTGELGFDVMTPEDFDENYEVREFDEETQIGIAELLDTHYPLSK